ncbi:endonuclease/exonuclease/phosphatase family protein [Maribacter sp. ANRC-HE7]|uniref:Endonuclease/exonuclease/phosphatase family protein n=1 Tax=Maribacter aquimaris TaxID=2737171 RepID=A0ABR7UXU7_9FLAO|nr:endonuclease/exonuclease/phosphatase family protein [Maribacter aquimaris]MBD0776449.1 endonuclease/exonuclease/phosphatase family protein [Maribacter aquimaris]
MANKIRLLLCVVFCVYFNGYSQTDTLKVISFNILHGATTKNDFNLDTIAGVINKYKPDLVAMQEVDFKTNRAKKFDLPTEIGIRTNMVSLFARAMYFDGGEYGEAVLSKLSFIASENIPLPHQSSSEPRAALLTRVKTKNGNVIQFVGTHLDHLGDNTDRLMQAKAINEVLGASEYPTLLVGDLNDGPDSETLKILRKTFYKPQIPEARQKTWPANQPKVCLDHILYNMPERWKVIDYEIVCENYASDHCIVIATLVYQSN